MDCCCHHGCAERIVGLRLVLLGRMVSADAILVQDYSISYGRPAVAVSTGCDMPLCSPLTMNTAASSLLPCMPIASNNL